MTDELNSIIKLEEAARTLAELKSVDEVKSIRDKAEVMRVYVKQAKLGLESQNYAAEIKLRAERRAGELLRELEPRKNSLDNLNSPSNFPEGSSRPKLKDLNITEKQSANWQKIAVLPEERFEAHIAETKEAGEELTTASVLRVAQSDAFDYKRDNKANRAGDEYIPQGYDACQTPPYAIDPLLPYLDRDWTIWEPAQGEGLLVEALYDSGFSSVTGSDLLTGGNFFEYQPPAWDALVTNPPFSLKYKWLERCYQLGKPFALLVPVEMLGAKTAQELMKNYGFEVMLLNRRVSFKMPNKGWEGAGAQFPVMWLCWQLLPEKVVFGEIVGGSIHE